MPTNYWPLLALTSDEPGNALNATLAPVTASAAGVVAIVGAAAGQLGPVVASASGVTGATVGNNPITGTTAATLGAVTSAAAGAVTVTGALAQTLQPATVAGVAGIGNVGVLAQTLQSATVAAAGRVEVQGVAAPTLGALTASSAGVSTIAGAGAVTLQAVTCAATGTVAVVGAVDVTLGPVTLAASNLPIKRIVVPVRPSYPIVISVRSGMATEKDITIHRGDDVVVEFPYETLGSIAGKTTQFTIRKRLADADPAPLGVAGIVLAPGSPVASGTFGVVITRAQTLALSAAVYQYALRIVDPGAAETVAKGRVRIAADVQAAL